MIYTYDGAHRWAGIQAPGDNLITNKSSLFLDIYNLPVHTLYLTVCLYRMVGNVNILRVQDSKISPDMYIPLESSCNVDSISANEMV